MIRIGILLCNLAGLLVITLFAFNRNIGRLLTGLDGPVMASASEEQLTFFGRTLSLHSNILEGLGSTSNALDFTLMPRVYEAIGSYTPIHYYVFFVLQLFICVILIGWNYKFSARVTYTAAWLLTILFFPYFENFRIFFITEATPHFVEYIFVFALMDIGIQRMGEINWLNTLKYGVVLCTGILYGLIFSPHAFMVIFPVLAITSSLSLASASNREALFRKLITGLAILIFFVALGWAQYLLGMTLDSAASFFYSDMTGVYHSLFYASILFHWTYAGCAWGPWLICSATLGMLVLIYQSSEFKQIAWTVLITEVLLVGTGAILMSLENPWLGPSPVYFEVILFPFYAIFAVYFYGLLLQKVFKNITTHYSLDIAYPFILMCVIAILLCIQVPVKNRIGTYWGASYSIPAVSTPITDILEKEIAINLYQPFRGRVANILLHMDCFKQLSFFMHSNSIIGNDHQGTGLWLKHIPTLHEYHEEINPGFYRIYRRFLSDPGEISYRTLTNFSRINLPILRLLGVRFVISTSPEIKGTKLRTALKLDTQSTLYLHELSGVNTTGISASRIINTKTLQEAENVMASKYYHLDDAIVTANKESITNYVPATKKMIRIEKGGFRIQAESKGKTFLILPIEYSNCLYVKSLSGILPTVIKVDIALTGLIFDRKVDIIMDNRTGPFTNPRCKWNDYVEFKNVWG